MGLERLPWWGRSLVAVAVGLAWASSFPLAGLAGVGWLAPGLLLWVAWGASPASRWRHGFVAGLSFALALLHWLLHIPVPWVPILGWVALSCYVALYPAIWVWAALGAWDWLAARRAGYLARCFWALGAGLAWGGLELVQGRFLSGFPWTFLGVSQHASLPVAQFASLAGVIGVSTLMAWFSTGLFLAARRAFAGRGGGWGWVVESLPPLVVVVAVAGWGMSRLSQAQPPPDRTIRAALVQPSIPQTVLWDSAENSNRFTSLIQLSELALATRPDLMVWPEAALPEMLRYSERTAGALMALATNHHAWLIVGSDDAEAPVGAATWADATFFNSAFAISPDGRLSGMYAKRKLVIFGEYMPLMKQFPFLKHFSPIGDSGFTPGDKLARFQLGDLEAETAPLICFEDVFPDYVRAYPREETDFLLNLTNNGWFGESAAQWQHAAISAFRAIENCVTLVRCTNNGLTCVFDPFGRMRDAYFDDDPDIYRQGFKIVELPVYRGPRPGHGTFYHRHGDLLGWAGAGVAAAMAGVSWRVGRRKGLKGEPGSVNTSA